MKVTIGEKGLSKTWQSDFPAITRCCYCDGEAKIGFVAHEGMEGNEHGPIVCDLHDNAGKNSCWLHNYCAVAVYFCMKCLNTTALYNQS